MSQYHGKIPWVNEYHGQMPLAIPWVNSMRGLITWVDEYDGLMPFSIWMKRITNQTPEIEEREWFMKYTLVHFVQVAYTRGLIEQKERIRMHAFHRRKSMYGMENQGLAKSNWSKVFGLRYVERPKTI